MNIKDNLAIYLMPGMAASPKIFERLQFPSNYRVHLLDWITPEKNESLAHYAGRIAEEITEPSPILLGVSFGGIIIQEIAKQCDNYKKLIVVSSVKTQYELPKKMLLARYTNLHKLLPTRTISNLEFWKRFSFSEVLSKRIALYEKYIGMRSPTYLDWSIDRIVNWQQKEPLPRTIHIHGDKDPVFPIQYIKNAVVVKNGTHIMIINRYKWFNENLNPLILEN